MTYYLTAIADPAHVAQLRRQNDEFRRSLTNGAVLLSAGVVALGEANQARIIEAVRTFSGFTDDDPWDAHDIGDLDVEVKEPGIQTWTELVFFKVQCTGDELVLSIMLASEW